MSKKKARPPQKKRLSKVTVGLAMILCLAVGILARWSGAQPFNNLMALSPTPTSTPTPTPNPMLAPKRAAKEYIYVGGKLQAIEEPKPPAGGAAFDFTGNSSGDAVVWRPSEGNWYVLDLATNLNTLQQLGLQTDYIAPGDYDGDGKTDIAVWRPKDASGCNNCGWFIKRSSDQTVVSQSDWGQTDDYTVPADYDGDGKTDIAVWRPSEGKWYIIQSATNAVRQEAWGVSGDKPVAADYDGDGLADLAVFRPTEGNWYIKKSTGGSLTQGWGASSDVLAPADYDGDGKADIAIWRASEGNWYILQSSNGVTRRESWGVSGDQIVPADYDGDGRVDIAVWRPSEGTWYIKKSSDGTTLARNWGQEGDKPVSAAYVRN